MLWQAIQRWYDKMSLRERGMLIAFVWALVLIWLSAVSHQLRTLRGDLRDIQVALSDQRAVLDQQHDIDSQLNKVRGLFDHSYDSNQLFAKVNQFAQESDLGGASVTMQRSDNTDIFNINTVSVHLSKAPLRNLVAFATKIEAESPYLAIDDLTLHPDTLNPTQIDAEMRVSSLELKLN
jgi:hypothetical protein